MNLFKLFVIIVAAAFFAVACGQSSTPNVSNATANKSAAATPATPATTATQPDEMAMAKQLYSANCAVCHKESGKGGKVTVEGNTIEPDDITTAKMAAKPDEKFYKYIADGFPEDGMPAFKSKLSDAEIQALIKHVRSLQKS